MLEALQLLLTALCAQNNDVTDVCVRTHRARRRNKRGRLTKDALTAVDRSSGVDPEMYFKTMAIVQSLKSRSRPAAAAGGDGRRQRGSFHRRSRRSGSPSKKPGVVVEPPAGEARRRQLTDQDVVDDGDDVTSRRGKAAARRGSESLRTATADEAPSSRSRYAL